MKDITKSKLWSEEAIESGLERDFPFLCTVAELREALWTIDLWIAFGGKDTDWYVNGILQVLKKKGD